MLASNKTIAALATAALLAACGGSAAQPPDAPSAAGSDAQAVLTAKCGTCHAEPEAGKATKAEVEQELTAHADRVQLTDAETQALIAYLGR
jgi:hypothetical protein